ncbi:ATR-interacting protein isoform X2 [Danio aesculapii]|uniref:ATR-interacting protein isoform X2 n=1 Tax=Danio aesculapii TaxID=1142201 RepID=UPI0024C08CBC|nr:ATR-interacting protein isoform X2 [Danio aesculapii]
MDFPPSKRLKGPQVKTGPDPFDDDIDFTQDDLEQIDIIASQAISADVQNSSSKRSFDSVFACADEPSKAPVRSGRKTFALGDACSSSTYNNTHAQRKDTSDGHSTKDGDDLYYKQLEEQQAELKKKLKEVEEEILMKNGEIRVLRDSLKQAHQEREQHRQAQIILEKEKTQAQSDREKELSRKVQSLQSELHFKEAEMNEMRGKLQSVERGGKQSSTPARPVVKSPVSRTFMTKENFSAELSKRTSPVKPGSSSDAQSRCLLPEDQRLQQCMTSDLQKEGCVLLKLLLQQPLDPSALGLCHLLSISPDALPNLLTQHACISPGSLSTSSSSSTDLRSFPRSPSRFHHLQSLAMSALTALSLHQPTTVSPLLSCPSAVHFLPLLSFHISTYCQSLEVFDSSTKTSLHSGSLSGSSDSSLSSILEESLSGQEELALAALRALQHIVCYSKEALEDVIRMQTSKNVLGEMQNQMPVLRRVLQLADPAFSTAAGHREALVGCSWKILSVLAERAQDNLISRLQVVMSNSVLCKCLTLETTYRIVHLCVRFLSFIICNDEMATKLCSHDYPCPFLKIFQYVTSRPHKSSTEDAWSCLELVVIRLLTKLFTQKTGTWVALCESSCQCVNEVVRTVVVVLHRQWLKTKCRGGQTVGTRIRSSPGLQVLREALMLLHWLLLKDSAFSEHCLDVLHMYDQVIPAIRDTFRQLPDLSESEELALEEICRSETEYVEDMDVETGS